MTITGSRSANVGKRSNVSPSMRSMRAFASVAISGSSAAIRREVKARSTRPRRRVCAGGSRSSMERSSIA